ncbi:MAG TPA: class I SAM-dependent methyltransferase [Patescibacteria group bacterium]|nr:class I SAM-dependent methyltransferase [Patescibacteria group bacterium]
MSNYLIFLALLCLIMVGFLILYILVLIDQLMGHTLPTSLKATEKIIEVIKEINPDATNFYDLGCARGRFALAIKKQLPSIEVVAIDNSRLRIFFAKIRALILHRKIKFIKNDIFKQNLSEVDVLYSYLWYDWLPPLEEKLKKELKKGSVVITNTSCFPNWNPIQTIILNPQKPDFEKLFVYIK